MHCPACGHMLEQQTEVCPRCRATISPAKRRQQTMVSFVYAIVAILFVTVLTYLVLMWHDSQFPP